MTKLNKKTVELFLKQSDKINGIIIEGDPHNPNNGVKWEIIINWEFKSMTKSSTTTKSLENIVNGLVSTVDGLVNTVNKLVTTVNELVNKVNYLESTVDGLVNKVNHLESTVDGLVNKVNHLESTVNDLIIKVDNGFKEVNYRLDRIESCPTIQRELKMLDKK